MARVEAVHARGITRVFRGRAVLRGVSATFAPGTISFIEGANGAGKSTFLAILALGLAPTAGTVDYHPLGSERSAVLPELGWLSHESWAYGELTPRENIALAARLRGVDERAGFERVSGLLALGGFADQAVSTLSRGQRQRAALGRALVHRPAVVLLDEPLTGLDRESVERVARVLVQERDRGAIVVVVNHVDGFAERVDGRRLRLEAGRIA